MMEAIRDAGPKLKSFFYHVCKPNNDALVKGCVVVLHGAEGYGGRYEPLGEELVKHGYAMFAIDHIGHGKTNMDNKDLIGKWEKKDFYFSAYNAYYLVDKVKKMYPGKPVYILGDDYGGAMAQYMMGKFDNIFDGVIISSCGMPSFRDHLMFLSCWVKKVLLYDGGQSKGTFRNRTRFLNMHFRPNRTKYDWMNSVNEEVDRFIDDPLSGYVCTIGYYYYQYKYIVAIPRINRLKKTNRNLPMLFLGGGDDYITHRGKLVESLKSYYEKKGFHNVESIIYDRSRHDVLLEWNKEQVALDIVKFINKNFYNSETYVEKESHVQENEVGEVKELTLGDFSPYKAKDTIDATFVEEEPEDDLKLSTEIKK